MVRCFDDPYLIAHHYQSVYHHSPSPSREERSEKARASSGTPEPCSARPGSSSSALGADWQDPSAMGGLEEIKNEAVDLVRNQNHRRRY